MKPEPAKTEPAKTPAKPEPAKADPKAKPDAKAKPEPKKETASADPLASLLSDVSKLRSSSEPAKDGKGKPASSSSASSSSAKTASNQPNGGPKATQGPDRAFKPSGKAIDAIRSQVGKNWNFDPGRKDAGNMVVEIRIDVAPDGTVLRADLDDATRARAMSDSHFRAAAESALRAIMKTQKLDLLSSEFTPDTYDKWRTIIFKFDPRDMF